MSIQGLRREDAANRQMSLAWLGEGDYRRAIGWARLLINNDHRMGLLQEISEKPEARAEAERAIAAEVQALKEDEERKKWKGQRRAS